MNRIPEISVIITAHNRKEFIRFAVKSVLSQDFEKDAFEIIVVCNFVDEDLGQYLSSNGVKYLLVKADAVGKKIAEAVTISKGEILCFLEDDDLFTSQKLSTVSKIFKQHDVGFCLNSFTTIDIRYGLRRFYH